MVCEILKHWKKSRIELDYLQQQCRGISYEDFAVLIRECMEKGILLPIKSAGRDGGGLPYKFSIARGKLLGDNVAYINNIVQAGEFSSLLSFSWYYEQPQKIWEGELPYIRLLDAYLKHEQKIVPAGIQQRSFEIFKNEKWLLEHGDFLGHVGLLPEQLGIVSQPDPLMLAVNPVRWQRCLKDVFHANGHGIITCYHLVVENKAAYYGLLPYLADSPFVSIILGYGWKIAGNLSQLAGQLGQLPVCHRVLYFGDFDAEGISIWYSLTHGMQVQLATEFYRAMLDLPPVSGKENQQLNQAALDAFAGCFSREEGGRWQQILQGHMYYPQEILSAEVLGRVLCRYNEILA